MCVTNIATFRFGGSFGIASSSCDQQVAVVRGQCRPCAPPRQAELRRGAPVSSPLRGPPVVAASPVLAVAGYRRGIHRSSRCRAWGMVAPLSVVAACRRWRKARAPTRLRARRDQRWTCLCRSANRREEIEAEPPMAFQIVAKEEGDYL